MPDLLVLDIHRGHERAQLLNREPLGVGAGVVHEARGHVLAAVGLHPGLVVPLHVRVDHEVPLELEGRERVRLGDHALVELLALADAHLDLLEIRGHRGGEVGHPERGDLGDEGLAALGLGERLDDEPDALVEGDPEARHAEVGDGELGRAAPDQLVEEWNDRSPGARDIAVAHDGEGRARLAAVGVRGDEELVRDELGAAVEVHRVHGLVGGEGHHLLDPGVERGIDDRHGAVDVGLDGLHGIVLAGGHLLERRRVDDVVHAPGERAAQARLVAYVADEEAEPRVVVLSRSPAELDEFVPHHELLVLVARVNDDLLWVEILQYILRKCVAE